MAMLVQATDRISLPIFSVAFRPFFLLGGVWSALALGIWIFAFVSGRSLSGSLSAVDWHIHEMLFGFVMAAIAGFVLTAEIGRAHVCTPVPNAQLECSLLLEHKKHTRIQ